MTSPTFTRAALTVSAAIAAVALAGGGYWFGAHHANSQTGTAASALAPSGERAGRTTGRKVLYWHDPMVPQQHFDKPGKSPFMDMQLQPVYADDQDGGGGGGAEGGGIKVDPALQQNLGIRYATVRRVDIKEGFDAVGTTQFDESLADVVQSRVTGYIDRLYANAPMQRVTQGAPIASLFVPDWLAPQQEYLALKQSHLDPGLLDAARARMRAMSIPDAMINALEHTGQAQSHLTLRAPETGVITELSVRDGAMVTPGQTLAKVAGLTKLWLIVEVPESLALQVRPGMDVDAVFAGDRGQHFTGHIREILPGISPTSRTLQARLEIENPDLELTPGMLMRAQISAPKSVSHLVVPSEAVITTGKRSLVIVRDRGGRMRPVQVSIGKDHGDDTEILAGLTEGEQVVASGQFLIDSEASLKSILPRLDSGASAPQPTGRANAPRADAGGKPPAATTVYQTTGKVEAVTPEGITFSHQPVPALGWGAMTMTFGKASPAAFPGTKPGQTVHFEFEQRSDGYQLTKVEPIAGAGK